MHFSTKDENMAKFIFSGAEEPLKVDKDVPSITIDADNVYKWPKDLPSSVEGNPETN